MLQTHHLILVKIWAALQITESLRKCYKFFLTIVALKKLPIAAIVIQCVSVCVCACVCMCMCMHVYACIHIFCLKVCLHMFGMLEYQYVHSMCVPIYVFR